MDDVAAQARAREAELRASLQFGAFDPLRHGAQAPADPALEQQLKQALPVVEGAKQDLANWEDNVEYCEDRPAVAEEKLDRSGYGAATLTFSDKCTSSAGGNQGANVFQRMFARPS